jgi:hypothetical protein
LPVVAVFVVFAAVSVVGFADFVAGVAFFVVFAIVALSSRALRMRVQAADTRARAVRTPPARLCIRRHAEGSVPVPYRRRHRRFVATPRLVRGLLRLARLHRMTSYEPYSLLTQHHYKGRTRESLALH